MQFHVDPCERAYCRSCDFAECAVRERPFEARRPFTAQSVAGPPRPQPEISVHTDTHPRPLPG
jgi:hypothetical protein